MSIPVNSESHLIDETTSRFRGAVWYSEIRKRAVTLVGCGGIGSWTALLLSRLKPKSLYIMDPDKIEIHNMSGQLFPKKDIHNYKVNSIAETIREFSDYHSYCAISSVFGPTSSLSDIMICGLDNMSSRSFIFNKWLSYVESCDECDRENKIFIDGRLSATDFQVFAIQGNDEYAIKKYQEEWLFLDSEAENTVCSFKQTSYMASMIASTIVNILINFIANSVDIIPREVPFMTSYSSDTMLFKIE